MRARARAGLSSALPRPQPPALPRSSYPSPPTAPYALPIPHPAVAYDDYARLGELYRNHGRWNGRQIVPEAWVAASIRADAPHLQPGRPILADHPLDLGYGYQWWLPAGDLGEFSAMGIYNQLVFVDPSRAVTIVKLSANPAYGTTMDEATNREMENIAVLRAIAASLGIA